MIYAVVTVRNRTKYLRKCLSTIRESLADNVTLVALSSDDYTQHQAVDHYRDKEADTLILEDGLGCRDHARLNCRMVDMLGSKYNPKADDIILLSADDYEYLSGWRSRLSAFLHDAPVDIALVSCELEPLFPWNAPKEVIEHGGVRALVRETVPGANWAFRWRSWNAVRTMMLTAHDADSLRYDMNTCGLLYGDGYRIAALNLADHVGKLDSTNGNMSFQVNARPLPAKWQV